MAARLIGLAIGIAVAAVFARVSAQADTARVTFELAKKTEVVDGDLRTAIEQYKTVAAGADRTLAAQALLRMAGAYRKLGSSEADTVYARVVTEYADVPAAAGPARDRLGSSGVAQSAAMTLRKVWGGDISGTVSHDGRLLSYNDWAKGYVGVRDLIDGTSRAVTESDYNASGSALSKDGSTVAFTWVDSTGNVELRLARADGKDVPAHRSLLKGENIDWVSPMDWSPDSRSIVVSLTRRDLSGVIGLVRVSDGRLTPLKSTDWRGPTRAFFSPDGRYVGFDLPESESTDQRDVFILALDGTREIPAVTHPAQDVMAGWSPDGRELLFASDRRDGAMGLWGLRLEQGKPSGSPYSIKPAIGTGLSLGVSRDGSLYLGMPAGDGDLASVTIDVEAGRQVDAVTKPAQSIGSNTQPQWSPDGRFLAYSSARGFNPARNLDQRLIVIQDLASGRTRELKPQLSYFNQLSWSPDGRAFLTGGKDMKGRAGIYRIDAQTSETVRIVDTEAGGDAYPRWSPDGTSFYYHRDGIVEREIATGRERQIVKSNVVSLGPINLSPDGRSMVMGAPSTNGATSSRLLLIPIVGGEPRELLRIQAPERFATFQGMPWLPNGKGVLVRRRNPKGSEIWFVPLSGTPRKLDVDASEWATGPIGALSLHPDGRRLAFLLASTRPTSEVWKLERFLAAPSR